MASNGQITPQVDVAGATIQGLTAFTPLLIAMSSNNISPMALLQAHSLGDLFHVNGKYAAQVPDLITRVVSVRVQRLGIALGWRKGDTASALAKSAGGQAFAMVSLVLCNLWSKEEQGVILHELSRSMLPREKAVSSQMHLADIATLAGSKLETIGFGNELARWASEIHDHCKSVRHDPLKDLFAKPTVPAAVDLLSSLARLREEDKVVRIRGTAGMSIILGIISFLFPEDCIVVGNNTIIREGSRKRIWVEYGSTSCGKTQITVETVVEGKPSQTGFPL